MQWIRLYNEILDDPKLEKLTDFQYRCWIRLLALANTGRPRGTLPTIDAIAYRLRLRRTDTQRLVAALLGCGLLDPQEDGRLAPHNWSGRQKASDGAAERMARTRAERMARTREVIEVPSESLTLNGEPTANQRRKTVYFQRTTV